jgi:hypothetical protein
VWQPGQFHRARQLRSALWIVLIVWLS